MNYMCNALDARDTTRILGFFNTDAEANSIVQRPLDPGVQGVTITNVSWDYVNQVQRARGRPRVTLSLVRIQPEEATTVQLIGHELAHSCGASHDGVGLFSTDVWESLWNAAWLEDLSRVPAGYAPQYYALEAILN
jgi:hypothetical protein